MNAGSASYHANGKLLLTGEYLIMYGAKSLALPVKFGQRMEVSPNAPEELRWEAYIKDEPWFAARFALPGLQLIETNDNRKAEHLLTVIRNARQMNPVFLPDSAGYKISTRLNYPQEWGLGSSSTFIANLAQWANVDAMQLNSAVSNGSGYDIACAGAKLPILFQITDSKANWKEIAWQPSFSYSLYFVYLDKKQNSFDSVADFRRNYCLESKDIEYISALTERFTKAQSLEEAISCIDLHETYMSGILKTESVKQRLFPDFNGTVKSLGAWGGDFVMAASEMSEEQVRGYFKGKGFGTVFSFEEMTGNWHAYKYPPVPD